jgi:hypothetical protein
MEGLDFIVEPTMENLPFLAIDRIAQYFELGDILGDPDLVAAFDERVQTPDNERMIPLGEYQLRCERAYTIGYEGPDTFTPFIFHSQSYPEEFYASLRAALVETLSGNEEIAPRYDAENLAEIGIEDIRRFPTFFADVAVTRVNQREERRVKAITKVMKRRAPEPLQSILEQHILGGLPNYLVDPEEGYRLFFDPARLANTNVVVKLSLYSVMIEHWRNGVIVVVPRILARTIDPI